MVNKKTKLLGLGVGVGSLALAFLGSATPAQAAGLTPAQWEGLNLKTAAGYGIISYGNGTTANSVTFAMNSGPILGGLSGQFNNDGSVLLGGGSDLNFSGGNQGGITGKVYYDPLSTAPDGNLDCVNVTAGSSCNNAGMPVGNWPQGIVGGTEAVTNAFTLGVKNDALAVSAYASSLAPDLTFGSLPDNTNIVGNGGLNVINLTEINNADFTLSGTSMDWFVFNVSDKVQTNRPMTLVGVDPAHILFNLTGTGTVFQTSGGNVLSGTFLSPNGGDFQFSNLALTGSLINIGGDIQYVSGSKQTSVPLEVIPEPLTILGAGTAAGFGAFFKRQVAKKKKDEKEAAEV
jgi:hypothetical protein